ncbi:MAG: hypothetical protein U5O39_14870 [Gammaproteobacteria bacterium]|nr:hypothetical protein [Gammaproteobacteria bacterium]
MTLKTEVNELIADLEPIVAAHQRGEDTAGAIEDYIEHWEDAGVHGAIEMKATVTYPSIWQAIIMFQRAAAAGNNVEAAAERVKSALWQGYGASAGGQPGGRGSAASHCRLAAAGERARDGGSDSR